VTALDAITAFAVPNPNYSSQSRRFFQVWLPVVATHALPDNSRPPYQAARVWVKRNGQWQMAISVQTDIK